MIKAWFRKVLQAVPPLGAAYAAFKGRQQERVAAADLEFYAGRAAGLGIKVKEGAELAGALAQRLAGRGLAATPRAKGELHVFLAYPLNNWESVLEKALRPFGKLTVFEWKSRGYDDMAADWALRRDAMNAGMLDAFRRAGAERKVDVVVGYLSGWNTLPSVPAEMGKAGAVVLNFCLDDKLHFRGIRMGGRYLGPCDLAKEVDLNLTCAPESLVKYFAEGGLAMFWPEGAQPELHKPYELPFEFDVSFVGKNYGWRPAFIRNLRQAGIKVTCFGNGWENGPLSDERMIKLYSRSRINLGFSGIGYSKRLMGLKGRDFEVPMSGGLYLTQHNPELETLYKAGEEIFTYHDEKDCAETIKGLLADPARAERVRKAGRARALRDHTWERRFEDAFRLAGILK